MRIKNSGLFILISFTDLKCWSVFEIPRRVTSCVLISYKVKATEWPAKSHPEVLDDINKTGICLQFHSPAELDSHHNIEYTAAILNYIQLKVDIFINHIVLH